MTYLARMTERDKEVERGGHGYEESESEINLEVDWGGRGFHRPLSPAALLHCSLAIAPLV